MVNDVINTFADEAVGDVSVDPLKGTVAFGSGRDGYMLPRPPSPQEFPLFL